MMKRVGLFLLLMGLAASGWGQKKRELTTPVTMNYLLPQTTFRIEVNMECTEGIPGPFQEFAGQQLGVQPDVAAPSASWSIRSIRVMPVATLDKKLAYSVTATGDYTGLLLQLSPEGFLQGVGMTASGAAAVPSWQYARIEDRSTETIDYVKFGIQSTLKEELDSNFTMVEIDGEMHRAWDPIERYVLKEKKEYVQEITETIFAIREKRLALLTGEQQSGGAVTREALEALETLEQNYLSLFLGKKTVRSVTRTFYYTPQRADDSEVLFRFSEREGITDKNNAHAHPFLAEIRQVVVPPQNADGKIPPAGITYWVPANGRLVLTKGKEVILEEPCVVSQLGYTRVIPLEVISNEGLSIEFFPTYGSIKGVTRESR